MLIETVLSPHQSRKKYPISDAHKNRILQTRKTISDILAGRNQRLLVFVGPCSIHEGRATLDYAQRLAKIQKKYQQTMFFVMRAHCEKPRTAHGWRGLVMQPDLSDSCNIGLGLVRSRELLVKLAHLVPISTEFVDPLVADYFSDLLSFGVIGARSVESQIHRSLVSGLAMPSAFKNPRDGDLESVLNAIEVARYEHAFLGLTADGCVAGIHTTGNQDTHVILRGTKTQANYDPITIKAVLSHCQERALNPAIIIDCSHDNSRHIIEKQVDIFLESLALRKEHGFNRLRGFMLESFIQGGAVAIDECQKIEHYGLSITDPCLSWEATVELFEKAHHFLVQELRSGY